MKISFFLIPPPQWIKKNHKYVIGKCRFSNLIHSVSGKKMASTYYFIGMNYGIAVVTICQEST